ncbi:pilus assembly PilX N-terminal domain-containing protein [Deinococcus sp. Leaf326]|uniref:pilus assembly PilX N-terminal domain-containing protein n=1 Tax=Deinococcus sp. Leaf326 TaxID=1736338 RepID=UPI000AB5E08E|nr:pilus assembly PilX N-terminal domain-containing protein [Deinococcus sp. Leaf326]
MKTRPIATSGASLVLVVLFTMLLLAGILAATLQLSLGSRQNTADQKATLQAQYAAESNVSLIRSKLSDLQTILSKGTVKNSNDLDEDIIKVPASTKIEQLRLYGSLLCGFSTYNPTQWTGGSDFSPLKDGVTVYPNARKCEPAQSVLNLDNQFQIFADLINPLIYNQLPLGERPQDITNSSSRLSFWNDIMRSTSNRMTTPDTTFRLRPLRVVELFPDARFRFYVAVDRTAARGNESVATRVLSARSNAGSGIWWFEISLPSLDQDVLRTMHHRSYANKDSTTPSINFDKQVFEGSVFTNEKFLFTKDSQAQFKGELMSAGCTNLPEIVPADFTCSKEAGVYIGGNAYSATSGTDSQKNASLLQSMRDNTNVVFDSNGDGKEDNKDVAPDFTAGFSPLPSNANNQQNAAKGRDSNGLILSDGTTGITLDDTTSGLEMFAGDSSGAPLKKYDSGKWQETNPVYQYVKIYNTSDTCTWDTGYWLYADSYSSSLNRFNANDSYNNAPLANKRRIIEYYSGVGYYRYQINQQKCISIFKGNPVKEYRVDKDGNMYLKTAGVWPPAPSGKFNGVIYGSQIKRLAGPLRVSSTLTATTVDEAPPALASFSKITLASQGNINIDTDLTVSDTPCKLLEACTKNPTNILGIYSQSGEISIQKDAPNDLNIHATILASEREINVDGYNWGADRGDVNLIGGLTENWYGAFGIVGDSSPGYGRSFSYDRRLKQGLHPPYWPVSPKWAIEDSTSESSLSTLITTQGTTKDFTK